MTSSSLAKIMHELQLAMQTIVRVRLRECSQFTKTQFALNKWTVLTGRPEVSWADLFFQPSILNEYVYFLKMKYVTKV